MLEKLFKAIRRGDADALRALLADGADPDQQYSGGDSLLSLSMPYTAPSTDGQLAVLDLLLAAGVSPDSPYRSGTRPIFVWAAAGLEAAVSALVDAGADCSGVDDDGRSLVLCAASGGLHVLLSALIRDGAALEGTDSHGHSALHLAADARRWCPQKKDSTETIDVLLAAGAPVDARCVSGTPLHIAAERGRGSDVAALLAAGAAVMARTADGIEPLHLAALDRREQTRPEEAPGRHRPAVPAEDARSPAGGLSFIRPQPAR